MYITAFDSGDPDTKTSIPYKVNILRNLNRPFLTQSSYTEAVFDYEPVGTLVFTVSAADLDVTVWPDLIFFYHEYIPVYEIVQALV